MKNIHILPTDKISRLFLNKVNNKLLLDIDTYSNLKKILPSSDYQNIYITNDEEIKEGDWVIDLVRNNISEVGGISNEDNNIVLDSGSFADINQCKKIILTTDQDLDGVQAIDDEFLEWFVKNPSCEYVNIEKYCRNGLCDSESRSKRDKMDEHRHEDPKDKCWYSGCQCPGERLIIPKEIHLEDIFNDEKKQGIKKLIQKQKLIDMMEQDEQLGLYQETLEESFLANIKNVLQFGNDAQAIRFMEKYFEAKQKRSYSEEEVKLAFIEGHNVCRCVTDNTDLALECFKKWFEQFKKK